MTSRIRLGLIFIVTVALLATLLVVLTMRARSAATAATCRKTLRGLQLSIQMYASEGSHEFPPNLRTLSRSEDIPAEILHCPGNESSDYVYIDWSTQPRGADWDSGKYPLLYDGHLSNHATRGVNIVMIDGTQQWDPDTEWLQRFATTHPNATIPIPK